MANSKFNLKNFLTENREIVINKFKDLEKEEFYNGITLKAFMLEVANMMVANKCKGVKTASNNLPFCMSNVYINNSKIDARDYKTEALRDKYKGTAYMAMV